METGTRENASSVASAAVSACREQARAFARETLKTTRDGQMFIESTTDAVLKKSAEDWRYLVVMELAKKQAQQPTNDR